MLPTSLSPPTGAVHPRACRPGSSGSSSLVQHVDCQKRSSSSKCACAQLYSERRRNANRSCSRAASKCGVCHHGWATAPPWLGDSASATMAVSQAPHMECFPSFVCSKSDLPHHNVAPILADHDGAVNLASGNRRQFTKSVFSSIISQFEL